MKEDAADLVQAVARVTSERDAAKEALRALEARVSRARILAVHGHETLALAVIGVCPGSANMGSHVAPVTHRVCYSGESAGVAEFCESCARRYASQLCGAVAVPVDMGGTMPRQRETERG